MVLVGIIVPAHFLIAMRFGRRVVEVVFEAKLLYVWVIILPSFSVSSSHCLPVNFLSVLPNASTMLSSRFISARNTSKGASSTNDDIEKVDAC